MSQEVNWSAWRTYAIQSSAINVGPGVGAGAIWNGQAQVLGQVDAAVPYVVQPIVYATVNSTAFANSSYNISGDNSWGILPQITNSNPAYIPRENGTFVDRVLNPIVELEAAARNFIKTTAEKANSEPVTTSVAFPTVPTYTGVPISVRASAYATEATGAAAAVATGTSRAAQVAKRGVAAVGVAGAAVALLA